jgi:hypothetical protein
MLENFNYKISWKREYKPVYSFSYGFEKETFGITLTLTEKKTGKSETFKFEYLDICTALNENDVLAVIESFLLDAINAEYPDLVKEKKIKKSKMNTCIRLYNKFNASFPHKVKEFLDDINLFISEEYYHKQSRKLKLFQNRNCFDSGMIYFTYNKI